MLRLLALLALLSTMMACKGPEPAPAELDDVLQFMWLRFNANDGDDKAIQDAELRDAVIRLDAAVGDLSEPKQGLLQDPTVAMATRVGQSDPGDELILSQGMYIANITGCSIAQNIELTLATNADELRPTTYLDYSKVHSTDADAFESGASDAQEWQTTYVVKPITEAYTANITGRARRVRANNAEDSPFGDLFMTQVVLNEPATFDSEGTSSKFTLDYQLEVYWEKDGAVRHAYAIWRRMALGITSSQDQIFIDTQLDGMLDWEKDADEMCDGPWDVAPTR
jgi:hypothetical protein